MGSLSLGFITLCSFLSSICGSSSSKGDVGKVVEFCPSFIFRVWVVTLSVDEDLVGEGGGKAGGPNVGYVSLLVLLELQDGGGR